MTRRKSIENGPSRLELNQYRLRKVAVDLYTGNLSRDDRWFLIVALYGIGKGDDANHMLGVRASRGERKTSEQARKREWMRFPLSWIAAAVRPKDPDGLGLSLDEAFERAAPLFGYSEETLRNAWYNNPALRTPCFKRPISTLPDPRDYVVAAEPK
jgi:hypothetical protein